MVAAQDPRRADGDGTGLPEQRDRVDAGVLDGLADPVRIQLPGAGHRPQHQAAAQAEATVVGVDVCPARAPAQDQAPCDQYPARVPHDQGIALAVGQHEVADQVGALVHRLPGVVELARANEAHDSVDVVVCQRDRGESRWQVDHRAAAARRSSTRSRRSHVKVEPPADSRPKWP